MVRIASSCILAAICSLFGDILQLATVFEYHNKSNHHNNFAQFKQFNTTLIQEEWELYRDLRPVESVAGLFSAASWVVFCIPMIQVLYKLSLGGHHLIGLHATIGILTIAAAMAEFVSHVMLVGAMNTMEWISTDFNLDYWIVPSGSGDPDGTGWRTLQVVFLSMRGMLLWINAVEWLFLSFILLLLFMSIRRQVDSKSPVKVSSTFGWYCLFLCLISLVEFSFEVLRFESWRTFSKFSMYVSVFSRLVLWPLWFLFLGKHLARLLSASNGYTIQYNGEDPMLASGVAGYPKQTPYPIAPTPTTSETENSNAPPTPFSIEPEEEEEQPELI
ncbi:hypothetical protein ACA910_010222 [Epithemia clementina (nom. ined.)]